MPSDVIYERLLQMGKQEGGLTTDDLQRVLDIERLSVDELSNILMRLESAGVSVDIDPAILWPQSGEASVIQQPDAPLLERQRPLPVASGASGAANSSPETGKAAPTVHHRRFGYLRDRTDWIAVAVALGAILFTAALIAITSLAGPIAPASSGSVTDHSHGLGLVMRADEDGTSACIRVPPGILTFGVSPA
jgi:hypothetical protein